MLGTGAPAYADDKERRISGHPGAHRYLATEDKRWIGIGYIGYRWNNDDHYRSIISACGTIWNFTPNWEAWFLLFGKNTDNRSTGPDVNELRPDRQP